MNFRRLDPDYSAEGKKGLERGAKAEESIWEEFADDPDRCARVAAAIMAGADLPELGNR
jgi:5-methylcytosine-specific restriction enzyme A